MSSVGSASEWYSALIGAMMYMISCYIEPHYNDTALYMIDVAWVPKFYYSNIVASYASPS